MPVREWNEVQKMLRIVTPRTARLVPAKLRIPSVTREVDLRKAIY